MTPSRISPARVAILAFVLACASMRALAQDSAKPFPTDVDSFSVEITEKGLNKLTMVPTGVHTDESTRFIFTGHQKGGMASALLFGIPGIVVSSEINSRRGGKRLGEIELTEGSLVETLALAAITEEFDRSQSNPLAKSASDTKHTLLVSPYAAVTQTKKDGTKLHAMLVVRLIANGAPEKPIWKSQFYGEFEGLLDEDVLSDPTRLYANLEQAFRRSAWGLAKIVNRDFSTYEAVTAKGWLAWFKRPGELPCILLHRDDENTLLRLPFGAMVAGSGYNVLSTSGLSTKPLKKLKDKYKADFER